MLLLLLYMLHVFVILSNFTLPVLMYVIASWYHVKVMVKASCVFTGLLDSFTTNWQITAINAGTNA